MAKETKTIQKVSPNKLNEIVELYGYFGWELMGQPQRIFNKTVREGDSRTDSSGNTTTDIITETIDYFTITFQRDKSMPNYAELCDLERQYYIKADSCPPAEPTEPIKDGSGCLRKLSITLIAFGLMGGIGMIGKPAEEALVGVLVGLILLILFIVPGIAILMISTKRANSAYSKKCAEWEIEHADWKKRRAEWDAENAKKMSIPEIIERAKTLLQ
jgi:hypothetical protein